MRLHVRFLELLQLQKIHFVFSLLSDQWVAQQPAAQLQAATYELVTYFYVVIEMCTPLYTIFGADGCHLLDSLCICLRLIKTKNISISR